MYFIGEKSTGGMGGKCRHIQEDLVRHRNPKTKLGQKEARVREVLGVLRFSLFTIGKLKALNY